MHAPWLLVAPLFVLCSAESGASLRGAVEALQRRQRGHSRGPVVPVPDYEALYEFIPPGYPGAPDYPADIEDLDGEPNPQYVVKLLDEDDRNPETYEYKVIKKKNSHADVPPGKKESAFRERSNHADNDRLRELFASRNEAEERNEIEQENAENDAEYALLLAQIWNKYKNYKAHSDNPQGVVKLYKEKVVKKRYPDNWGPIAFKRKRSSDIDERPISSDYEMGRNKDPDAPDSNYNGFDSSDDNKDDWKEEYAIAFHPIDDDSFDLSNDDQYSYDTIEKRFPVSKRSGPNVFNTQIKRFAQSPGKRQRVKNFRSSAGTDPRIIKDLSKIFGNAEIEIIKNPVKRNTDHEDVHDVKPPTAVNLHNNTQDHHNFSSHYHDDASHESFGHLHHPGISGKEVENVHDHQNSEKDKPIIIRKKSIDWSDYFGIDKRSKKFVNDLNSDKLKKQYFDTFNKEVMYPMNSFRKYNFAKRNYVPKPEDKEGDNVNPSENKEKAGTDNDSKLDNIDKKLKTMEGKIVDEALHYSDGEQLDTKEEQEMKEKLLSRLAAAYSLEKMRKALKEFKQSLQIQRAKSSPDQIEEAKAKRVAIKKEKVDILSNEIPFNMDQDRNDDFEDEQGAGHYLNGKHEQEHYSEGYMGGSGMHKSPEMATAGAPGTCPALSKIIQRCRGVDMLAGDRGQLFLPLCSLHQICYICGDTTPTTCDLVYLSEADTICEGDMSCQRAARRALMALRELHDSLADELDGECEANPCLQATLKLNLGWQRALQR